jgi:diguanylate cyclase (GGDEF)-like protein
VRTSPIVVVSAAVFVALAALLILGPGRVDPRTIALLDDAAFVILNLAAVLSSALAARANSGRHRMAWAAMALAVACWGVGDVLWSYYDFRNWETFPSVADVAYMIFPMVAAVALLLFPARRGVQFQARTVLDGVIVAGSLFIAAWLGGMGTRYHAAGLSQAEMLVSLSYPLSAVALLTVAAVVLVRTDGRHRASLTVLTVGLACAALASVLLSYVDVTVRYQSGDLIDLGWAASSVLITVAAWLDRHPGERPRSEVDTWNWASAWMSYVPLMIAAGALVMAGSGQVIGGPVPAVGVVVMAAVLVRQFLTDRENRRLIRTVSDQALHDPLTGLANRAYFQRRMNQLMDRGVPVAVLALDLNDFKSVNDSYGHAAGDQLLVAVAARIQECVRADDTVARLGGDEFVILVAGETACAHDVAERMRQRFAEPFPVAGRSIQVRFGLGIAGVDGGEPGAQSEDLLREADRAMYETKRSARAVAVNPAVAPASTATISS